MTYPPAFLLTLLVKEFITDPAHDKANISILKYLRMIEPRNKDYIFVIRDKDARAKMITQLNELLSLEETYINKKSR